MKFKCCFKTILKQEEKTKTRKDKDECQNPQQ